MALLHSLFLVIPSLGSAAPWAVVSRGARSRRLRPITCIARSKPCPRTSQAEVARIVVPLRVVVAPPVVVVLPVGAPVASAAVGAVPPRAVGRLPAAVPPEADPPLEAGLATPERSTPASVVVPALRRRSPSFRSPGSPKGSRARSWTVRCTSSCAP
jgi:hypothetical protein